MKRMLWALLLTAVTVTVAMWRAPASLIAGLLPPEISKVVQLHRSTGTVWRGNAWFSVTGVPPALSVSWSCRPSLAPFGVQCELSDALNAHVAIDVFANRLVAQRGSAALPVHVAVAGAATASSPNVAASFSDVTVSRSVLSIKGSIRASDSMYRLGNVESSLGELTVECLPSADAVAGSASSTCSVSNRGGNARLDGKLLLAPNKASGTLDFTPANGSPQRVSF